MEPLPQRIGDVEADGVFDQAGVLWREAPAWRGLSIATLVLAASAIAAPAILSTTPTQVAGALPLAAALSTAPQVMPKPVAVPAIPEPKATPTPETPSCGMKTFRGSSGEGTVLGFLNPQQAAILLSRTEAQLSATIDPDYRTNARAVIGIHGLSGDRRVVALVPLSMTVKKGDHVVFVGGHRNMALSCNFVPNLISSVGPPDGSSR